MQSHHHTANYSEIQETGFKGAQTVNSTNRMGSTMTTERQDTSMFACRPGFSGLVDQMVMVILLCSPNLTRQQSATSATLHTSGKRAYGRAVLSVSCLPVGHHLLQFTLPSSELLLLFVVDRM